MVPLSPSGTECPSLTFTTRSKRKNLAWSSGIELPWHRFGLNNRCGLTFKKKIINYVSEVK